MRLLLFEELTIIMYILKAEIAQAGWGNSDMYTIQTLWSGSRE
jgi:hypothetical protein